mgnify:CR=1 FL=1
MTDWRKWAIGLLGAVLNSAAGAGTLVIVDPQDFDPFGPGLAKPLKVTAALAIVGAFLYLQNHKFPVE